MSPRVTTRAAVAEAFGVTPRTIQTWERDGRIPRPLRIGRSVFFRVAEIEALLLGSPDELEVSPDNELDEYR